MALGLLLRVSWICFLLFDCSFGIPAIKGYGYPYKTDSRNIGDEGDNDALMFDDWEASDDEPTVANYKPSAAQWPGSALPQSQPNNPGAPEVERPVNGGSGNWGLNKPENLLISPLYQPNVPVKPQPGPVKPQSAVPTNHMPAFPAGFARPAAHESAPSSSFVPRKPEPVRNAYGVTGTSGYGSPYFGSSGSGLSTFQYPSENTGPSSTAGAYSQANYITQPAKPQSPASTNRMPANPAVVSTNFRLLAARDPVPSSGFVSPKLEPGNGVAGASGFGSPNSGSSRSGASHFPRLVYEEVFQYPSENTGPSSTAEGYSQANYIRPPAKPQSAASTNRMPAFPTGVATIFAHPHARESAPSSGSSSNTARYRQTNYRRPSSPNYQNVGTGFTSQLPQKPADGTKKVAQKVSEPRNPQIIPSRTYVVQSGNGYQRVKYLKTASQYTPQPARPLIMMPIRSKAVKGQPAAPKGVKNPQRTRW